MKHKSLMALKETRLGLVAGLIILLAALDGGAAAQIAGNPEKPLQHTVSVALKLVQVYVTGKDGRPVPDLAADEFEVSDNGQAVPVTHFERHFIGLPTEPSAPSKPVARLNRRFFLIFDFAFMDSHGVLKAKDAGLRFIDAALRPDDEVGLLAYTPYRGLVLYEYLTVDHRRVRRVVESFGQKKVTGRAENLTEYLYSRDLSEERTPKAEELTPEESFFLRQARLQTSQRVDEGVRLSYVDKAQDFILALNNLALALRRLPGYKNIILFSEGIAREVLYGKKGGPAFGPWSTSNQLAQQMRDYDAAQADAGIRADFTSMLQQFKAANAPVYALDVSRSQKEAEFSSPESTGQAARELEGSDSLRQVASETGGRFYANTVDKNYVAGNIQSATGAYYVLGYSVNETWDGKFHKIKVRVKREGCHVTSQGGYFNPKPFKQNSSFEKLLQITDLALGENPQLQVPEGIPLATMAVTVKGGTELLAFSRASRSALSEVLGDNAEAYLLLTDENGEISAIKRFHLNIPDAPKETYFPTFLLNVRPGRYECRMILRNLETGQAARGTASVVIPGGAGAPAEAAVLDPPLLLVPDAKSLDLAASGTSSLSALYGYDPNSYAPLADAVPAGTERLIAALRCTSNSPNPDFNLFASLQETSAPGWAAVPVSVLKKSQEGPTSLFLAEIGTGELRPGRYSLRIEAKEKGGPASASAVAVADFTVK